MLSVPVQLIAWKDRPRNDLLCVERDFKHLLTHSVMFTVVAEVKKIFLPYIQLQFVLRAFSALTLLVGWHEGHLACKN